MDIIEIKSHIKKYIPCDYENNLTSIIDEECSEKQIFLIYCRIVEIEKKFPDKLFHLKWIIIDNKNQHFSIKTDISQDTGVTYDKSTYK